MYTSYTSLIDDENKVHDELLSRVFTDKYNLMMDQNFLKIYLAQNMENNNKLIFTEQSKFYQKFLFLLTLNHWNLPKGLKRSPSMCKSNIISSYD